jgi:ATP-dependent DNA helicase RecG
MNELFENLKHNPSEDYESDILEFKHYSSEKALHNSKELPEEISALANSKGGNIIVGVKDSCNIKNSNWSEQLDGFERIDINLVKERISGRLSPRYNIELEEIQFEEKNYLNISVPKSKNSLISTTSGKTFIRIGRSSTPANPKEIESLVKSLHTYDWSDEDIDISMTEALDKDSLQAAKAGFAIKREIDITTITDESFLESIGATKNGILNKGGLIFLGKAKVIREKLGNFEYRFSWKTKSGELHENQVWNDNIWNTIIKTKKLFETHNFKWNYEFEKSNYDLYAIDRIAFHEGFLNAIVHRDYNEDGMISVNYFKNKLILSNPGSFYGGVNSNNISYHEPRHRNKNLAKILMEYQLVDRAGMGILRMSVNSLKFGRKIPEFNEKPEGIEVVMQAEYMRFGIFLLTQKYIPNCGIVELLILNNIYETGYVNISDLENSLENIISNPWEEIMETLDDDTFKNYVELKGNNDGVFICPKKGFNSFFEISNPFRGGSNSSKHIKLFKFLKTHGKANNGVLMNHLGYKSAGAASSLLKKANYTYNKGKSRNSTWYLKS